MSRRKDPNAPVPFPATVVIDTREQCPFAFANMRADACDGYGPLVITCERSTLPSGDYSLRGLEHIVAIERKSLTDLFSTIGQQRERFERELARLNAMRFAAVVVEADWLAILNDPPAHSQLPPKIVWRSVIAWQQRFRTVHWWMLPDRRTAEIATLRILERTWKDVGRETAKLAALRTNGERIYA